MLHPAPTSSVDPTLSRGVLEEIREATATKPAFAVLSFYNTNYRMHLRVDDDVLAVLRDRVGKRVLGVIRVGARKIAECRTGGRYVEPVFGAPQHVQGKVVAHGMIAGGDGQTIVLNTGGPVMHVECTHPAQSASDFEVGQLVTFDAAEGASFEPVAP